MELYKTENDARIEYEESYDDLRIWIKGYWFAATDLRELAQWANDIADTLDANMPGQETDVCERLEDPSFYEEKQRDDLLRGLDDE